MYRHEGIPMTEEDIVIGLEDIERALDGTRKAEARIAAFFRAGKGPPRVRTRGSTRPTACGTPGRTCGSARTPRTSGTPDRAAAARGSRTSPTTDGSGSGPWW